MRQSIVLASIITLCGCSNAVRMCGLETEPEWTQLNLAPSEEKELVALVREKQSTSISFEHNHRYWFTRKDGALLLCRQDPTFASNQCNSDGWLFTKTGSTWHVDNKWLQLCTG